jgi:hypothetical protein
MSEKRQKSVDLEGWARRYCQSSRAKKGQLLDELCDLYGYNRKYLIQFFLGLYFRKHVKRGPKSKYNPKIVLPVLKKIWLATDQLCSKKLKSAIPEWLPFYDQSVEPLDDEIKKLLLSMSPSTIDRLLKPVRAHYDRHGLSGTRPGYLLKNQIPIRTDNWDITKPGFMEADTVAHCGNSLLGDFVWSLTMTDILTGWTENRATWGKGSGGVLTQIKHVEKTIPFILRGFDCDNGSEFLNHHLLRYLTEGREKAVQFTRSRPYKKNDNAHVEQKNWTHVRQLFGYDRFGDPRLVALMNDLYSNEWSDYQNHFIPVLKLIEKQRVNSKYKKKYDGAKTPYQRILLSAAINQETKDKLTTKHKTLNPFELKKAIDEKLKHIFKYVEINKKPRIKI